MEKDEFKDKFDPSPEAVHQQSYIKKLEAHITNLKKQVGTDKNLFEYVKDSIEPIKKPQKVRYNIPKNSKHSEVFASLIITDTHSEEFVRSEEMEGLAHYDWDVFVARLTDTGRKALVLCDIMRQTSDIRDIHLWLLGDWFCGKIQPQEEAWGVTKPLPVAVPQVSVELGKFLVGLSAHFDNIYVTGMVGNHGREGKKTVFKMNADRNWDMSVYLFAQAYTEACGNIHWNIPESPMTVVDIAGWKCLLTHSGEVNMNNRTPYYPIEATVWQEHSLRQGTDKDFNYFFMGHWHHFAILDSKIILSPSMIGQNQFSRFKLHKNAPAEQLLCFFTEKHGLICPWPIKL